jgi:predicted nucleic-acid-binding Zn-ribbon protein
MKQSLKCPRCAHHRIWYVPQVQEHGLAGHAQPLGAVQGIDPFELFVCASCHYAEWYSPSPRALLADPDHAVIELSDYRLPCHGCGLHGHLLVAQLLEARRKLTPTLTSQRVPLPAIRFVDGARAGSMIAEILSREVPLAVTNAHGVAEGSFAVTLCRNCGLAGWYACNFRGDGCAAVGEACPRCKAGDRVGIPLVKEEDGKKLPVVFAWRERGSFRLDVCRACGFTEWFADLSDVKPGLKLLEGNAATGPARERNPYR